MPNEPLTRANLRTPKAAAIAGMLFSVLLIAVFWLLRTSIPADPQEPGSWLHSNSSSVALALNLMPFAGIAFLWFIGVLRDRLGQLEDRFFATLFFGSGLLFLAMLFTAAAIVGAILIRQATSGANRVGDVSLRSRCCLQPGERVHDQNGKRFHDNDVDRSIYTGIAPRWLAVLGYGLSLPLLFSSYYFSWSFLFFRSGCF